MEQEVLIHGSKIDVKFVWTMLLFQMQLETILILVFDTLKDILKCLKQA